MTLVKPGSSTFAPFAGADTDAIHQSTGGEVHALPLKATLVAADEIVIEDSADSWAKKRGTLTDLLAAAGGPVLIDAKNDSGADMSRGDVVYVSGEAPSGKPLISLADADAAGKCPSIGVLSDDLLDGAEGTVAIAGHLNHLDTSSWAAGDSLYLSTTPGQLINTRPAGTAEKVQNIGFVTRDHATTGSIAIVGSGRSNDIPNDLVALTGVALGDSDLGTFTGTTITDSSSIKTALQELETAVEASGSALTVTTVSSGPTYAASTYNTLYKVTAAAVVEVDLPTAVGHTGETIDVMAVQGATYTITVDPNAAETINGSAASITLTSDYANVTLVSDGSNWVIR
jgi:hypothetical protein